MSDLRRETPQLQRRISVPLLTLYGLGTMIGAGIYVILGAVVGKAGLYAPLAFVIASIIAGLTAASFAELSTRYPVSAGEAAYIRAGLGLPNISLLAGLAITVSGSVAAATLIQGGVGYLAIFLKAPDWLLFLALLVPLTGIAAWGISQSLTIAAIFTLLEVLGLVLLIFYAPANPISLVVHLTDRLPPITPDLIVGVSASIILAFYAFIGFEDMVNIIEEVKQPNRTMPVAIFLALTVATLLYFLVALVAVSTVSAERLAASNAPLALVAETVSSSAKSLISLIAIIAVLNGVIIQIVMASRILYGLSTTGQLPKILGAVSRHTHTPLIATCLVALLITGLGLTLPLLSLAETTSSLTLAVFTLVNLSLWRLKQKVPQVEGAFHVPKAIPVLGAVSSGGFLIFHLLHKWSKF